MHLAELLQPLSVPTKVWTVISMDFIRGLPKTQEYNVVIHDD